MKQSLLLTLLCMMTHLATAQSTLNFWTPISDQAIPENLDPVSLPMQYATFQLNFSGLKTALQNTPYEDLTSSNLSGKILSIPMPDGTTQRFDLLETSVFHPNTAANYPNIRAYKGKNLDQAGSYIRIAVSPKGVHAAIHTTDGQILIAPYAVGTASYYLTYHARHRQSDPSTHQCGFEMDNANQESMMNSWGISEDDLVASTHSAGGPVEMRQFRMALGASGEYSESHGGTVESVLEDFNIVVNRLNLVFEQNLATRFVLVDGIEQLIYLDAGTDPYNDGTNGAAMLGENATNLNVLIGADNFDIGHVLTGGCSGGLGGIAGGQVCDLLKGAGVTCHATSDVLGTTVEIMTHEVGHQLSAGHSWNGCPPNAQQYAPGSAWEPGSGSTIMSYSGSCGQENNVQSASDEYFHGGTIDQMSDYIRGGIADCGEFIMTDNNFPDVSIDLVNDFYIPIRTPFELEATGSDMDGDEITYCWEQRDTGPAGDMGMPEGSAPLFRSFPPTVDSNRIIPNIQTLVNNASNVREILPTYSRDINFSCTVRDNNPTIGGVSQAYVRFKATEDAGPFNVTSPNTAETFTAGQYHIVTWNVNNTDQAPVSCSTVNITMSIDGGYTYPIELANGVMNDGSHGIVMPDIETSTARIRVKAADNIFFDISNVNFSIVPAATPDYFVTPNITETLLCPSENELVIDLSTTAQSGFADNISFSIMGLPDGATASFSETEIGAGASTILTINTTDISTFGSGSFDILTAAAGLTEKVHTIEYISVDTDFSALELTSPVNGVIGVSGVSAYTWVDIPNADYYEFQVADNAAFNTASILESGTATDGTYNPTVQLEKGTVYYWRVRPVTLCGPGEYQTFALQTESQSCEEYVANDVPVNISSSGLPTVTSNINIPNAGTIEDINITSMFGEHDLIRHIRADLVSPAGTSVLLFNELMCGSIDFDLKFDDASPLDIPCPTEGEGLFYKVQDPEGLAKLNGEGIQGNWTMRIEVINTFGEGGSLDGWSFEICGSIALNPPVLVNNEPLDLPTGQTDYIDNDLLLAEDTDNTVDEIIYTIVETPSNGTLYSSGVALVAGNTFTQSNIDGYQISYQHDGGDDTVDDFVFTISDTDGGWYGTPTFNIVIDENAAVDTEEIEASIPVEVFPNPATDEINLRLGTSMADVNILIYNLQGQKLLESFVDHIQADALTTIKTSDLNSGIYFIEITSQSTRMVEKITIQR